MIKNCVFIVMGRKCCVTGCKSNYDLQDKIKVFRLPKDHEDRERWMKAIPRDNIPDTINTVVCEKHFPVGYETVSVKGRVRPKHPPSVFDHLPASIISTPTAKKRKTSTTSTDKTRMLPVRSLQSGDGDDNYSNLSDANSVEYMTTLNTSGQNSAEEIAKHELRKLSLDQNGTFMVDFDPEKSNREMRKMNRRIHSKDSKRNQLYDEKGLLLETSIDLCDCLDKECPGCHFPCQRCGSNKCGPDCRCHRKYTVDFIEVEGTETIYNFPC